MKRIIMKALFYLSKKKINKKGLAPIYCRITVNGKRSEISTGIFINPGFWCNEELKQTTQENIIINSTLSKIKNDIYAIYYELIYKNKSVSAEILRDLYTGTGKINYTFIELLNEYIDYKKQTITEYNTLKTYYSRKALIINFLTEKSNKNLLPEDFNIKICEIFMHNLIKKKLSRNYVNREVSFIKGVLQYGLKMAIIKLNPLAAIELKHDKPKAIVALSKKELLLLTTYKFVSERLQQVADMYIFQSFTGFSYADLADFDYCHHVQKIEGKQWILKNRVKSDVEAIIPVFNDAKRILKKYEYKLPVISNQKYNSYLKEITGVLGIKKDLTSHTARKTFAMIRLNDGFSIESVARMLGHNSIKVTQSTYATVGIERINVEFKKIGFTPYKKTTS